MQVALHKRVPLDHQPENVTLGPDGFSDVREHNPPRLRGALEELLETRPELLERGEPDRIPFADLQRRPNAGSLALIEPEDVTFIRRSPSGRTQVRCEFSLAKRPLNLAVTDPKVEQTFVAKTNGRYERSAIGIAANQRVLLTISLGEPMKPGRSQTEFCYKLVAGVIVLDR